MTLQTAECVHWASRDRQSLRVLIRQIWSSILLKELSLPPSSLCAELPLFLLAFSAYTAASCFRVGTSAFRRRGQDSGFVHTGCVSMRQPCITWNRTTHREKNCELTICDLCPFTIFFAHSVSLAPSGLRSLRSVFDSVLTPNEGSRRSRALIEEGGGRNSFEVVVMESGRICLHGNAAALIVVSALEDY